MNSRNAVFSGSWYPRQATDCEKQIRDFLARPVESPPQGHRWVAGIVPHAGWYYSGQIACQVINMLKEDEPIDLVVIFGMHLHPGSPNYIMPYGSWETPFGDLPVAEELARTLLTRFDFHEENPSNFLEDNTVELQMPFVKYLLDPETVLAVGVPPAKQSFEIGQAIIHWADQKGLRVKIIGSTDLTHYGMNYGYAPKGTGKTALDWVRNDNDRQVIDAMLAMKPEKVLSEATQNQNACCAGAAATAIASAQNLGATVSHMLAYATSYDKSPGESFVGYAGILFGI